MKKLTLLSLLLGSTLVALSATTNSPAWLSRPLSLADALNTALAQNAAILKAQNDLEASHGVVVQTRAVALPQLTATSQYKRTDQNAIESIPVPGINPPPDQNWNAGVQIVQAIYEGGKLRAAIQAASATKQQAIAQYDTQFSKGAACVWRRAAGRAANCRA